MFRPCDAVEAIECWELALQVEGPPSVLALTRQNLPQLRTGVDADNLCAAGAYEIAGPGGDGGCLDLRHRLGSLDRGRGRAS